MDMERLQHLGDYLEQQKLRLVTAESCTAGLVVATLGDLAGCGSWLECGYVTYAPDAKRRCLGVKPETIERYNLTSEQVACEMASGALRNSNANVAISNTGIAGPEPEDGIPPGTVCFAWAFVHQGDTVLFSETRRFHGDRNAVRQESADYAIARIIYHHERLLDEDAD